MPSCLSIRRSICPSIHPLIRPSNTGFRLPVSGLELISESIVYNCGWKPSCVKKQIVNILGLQFILSLLKLLSSGAVG
jgi:hypothetical protein